MNSKCLMCCAACVLLALVLGSWGFPVHRHINRSAVSALPEPLRGWMRMEVDWLSAHATDADKRKHAVEREAPRHYLDRDAPALSCLDTLGPAPWFASAVEACMEDTLWAYGVLPWQIQWSYGQLVSAFDEGDRDAILRVAADLGHYVADAHVPLHTTLNYNGQLTGQEGIHGVWETRLPELFGGGYRLVVPMAEYNPDVGAWAWRVLAESHALVEPLLEAELETTRKWNADTFVREERGGAMLLQRNEAWCKAYHDMLDGTVEQRWKSAISGVASLWYSAWVDAGSPDLSRVLGHRKKSKKRKAKRRKKPQE